MKDATLYNKNNKSEQPLTFVIEKCGKNVYHFVFDIIMAELKALIENRKEHVQYLTDVLLEPVLEEFSDIYQSVTSKSKILQEFQTELGKIPEWNHVMIGNAYERIKKRSGCKFLPDLLRAIFTTSVKCHLMTHGKMDAMSTIKFRVPTSEKFIHRLLIACAQDIWKQPYLFYHAVRSIERQYNRGKVEDIVKKQVEGTIRICLPMEQIVGLIHDSIQEEASSPSVTTSESSASESSESEEESSASETEDEEESDEELVSDVEVDRIIVEDDDAVDADSESSNDLSDEEDKYEVKQGQVESHDDGEIPHADADADVEESDNDEENAHSEEETFEPVEVIVEDTPEPEEVVAKPIAPVEERAEERLEKRLEEPIEETKEKDVQYFDELVKALEDEPATFAAVSDASPQRKSIEIHTSSEEESEDEGQTNELSRIEDDRKIIPLKNLLINERKFHRPKMMSRNKRTDRVVDAFY